MELSQQQQEALLKFVNIGFRRAADSLSTLVNQRVNIESPQVQIYSIQDVLQVISSLSEGDLISVHQMFSGAFTGAMMMVMDTHSTASLLNLLFERGPAESSQVNLNAPEDREALQEIANILLTSFTGAFGNLLHMRIQFMVPSLQVDALGRMMNTLMIDHHELLYALTIRINFILAENTTHGYVLIVLGLHSIDTLIQALQNAGMGG